LQVASMWWPHVLHHVSHMWFLPTLAVAVGHT
jgi:hypothetical protein